MPSKTLRDQNIAGVAISVGLIATVVVFSVCHILQAVILPIILAYFLYVLLEPVVVWAEKHHTSRALSAIILLCLVVAASSLAGWGAYNTGVRLAKQIPEYSDKISGIVSSVQESAERIQNSGKSIMPKKEEDGIQKVEVVESFGGGQASTILAGVNSGFELLAIALFIPLLALFFLLDKPHLGAAIRRTFNDIIALEKMNEEISQMMLSFFLGNLIVGLLTAAGFYALFAVMGLNNEVTLAIFGGFVNLIPVIGSVLGGFLPAIQALLQFDSLSPAATVFGASLLLHFFVANVVMPKIVGSRINVNSSAATIGLLFWGWLWGAVGMFLALPLTALIRIVLASIPRWAHWSDLIAEKSNVCRPHRPTKISSKQELLVKQEVNSLPPLA